MAKLASLILLLLLAAVATASAYTTVVTTRYSEGGCESEMREMMPMNRCMRYVESQTRGGYGFLRSAAANRRFSGEHLDDCCSELQQFSPECMCSAVKEMMMEMPNLEMRRMACSLPNRCGYSSCACPRAAV